MRIRRLPEGIVNRIAAGEVIERPSSIVKELVENAIDAGARRIEVIFRDGGRTLIKVSDDGHGMTGEELSLAVERHATSKLDDDDLIHIRSLGFRGEALPSIGAVSRLTIVSRARGAELAHAIAVEGGILSDVRPAAHGAGTTVEVRDVFFAVPARLKFLRSERAETAEAADVTRRLAIAHPNIAFTLISADRRIIDIRARDGSEEGLRARLADLMGRTSSPRASGFRVSATSFACGVSPPFRPIIGRRRTCSSRSSTAGRCATDWSWAPSGAPMRMC